ncbi:MAG: DUF4349 domain-containing protein [Elusimicrobia bacterium]|nr:DUF4349 domain-containing protein [Elusimicrobiota bacterium]
MNQWGAVKLGLVVAAAGAFGTLRFSHGAASPGRVVGNIDLLKRSSFQGLAAVAGAAGGIGEEKAEFASDKLLKDVGRDRFNGVTRAGVTPQGAVRKIVRTASLAFEVKDQAKARNLVRAAVYRNGAEIFSDTSSGDGDNQSGMIVIEAPPEKLEAILKELEGLGRVVSRSVSSQNMSEEYVDLKSRLENARKVERRLTELMEFKTNKLSDILELERELERVGGEIEQTIGRMKYIDTLAASSRITVSMAQPSVIKASEAPGVLTEIRNSIVGSFNTFVRTGLSLLNLTGFVFALGLWTLPVTGILWLLRKRIWGS